MQCKRDPIFNGFPESFDVFHWHDDMPGIPSGAKVLAYSTGCPRQAFCYGEKVYGIQCHLEFTKNTVEGLIKHCSNNYTHGKFIQNPTEFLQSNFSSVNEKMRLILDRLATKVR